MSIFKPVVLKWKNQEYRVEANQILKLIAEIEEFVTLDELTSGKAHFTKIAYGYHAALEFVGAKVSADEVYQSLFPGGGEEGSTHAVSGLLALMIPPKDVADTITPKAITHPKSTAKKKPAKKRQ